ncbi:MAG: CCA tRNA nucleotidyltransferase [Lachnospiraceae bacterium]|nr:CCA tRNA nucleotidyltransferase [Lachnospiraceae bacterium]
MIRLPQDVRFIIQKLEEAGYEAYAVGGCIRDCLLSRTPGDYDVTTSAVPAEVKRIFRRTFDTGIEHGTVTVLLKGGAYEVTTFRIDGKYEDSRHPSGVSFTTSLEEDLLRRDFTINAMAFNEKNGLADPFDGQKDLKDGIIRCVGDPYQRFSEDALRMMRAVRFAAQLGFTIEENTKAAIRELSPTLRKVSAERIQTELVKLITSDHPEELATAYELGLTAVFMPEFDRLMGCPQNNPHHCYDVGTHTIETLKQVENDRILRLGALFHDFGKPHTKTTDKDGIDHFHGHPAVSGKLAKEILRRLKFDNATIDLVSRLALYHDNHIERGKKNMRRAMAAMGEDLFPLVLRLQRADVLAQSDYKRERKLDRLDENEKDYAGVLKEGECFSLKDLAVKGKDLMEIGYQAGPGLGKELSVLLDLVIEEPSFNERETLLQLAKKHLLR